MPNAHTAYRPHPEVELLSSRPIRLKDAIRDVAAAVERDRSATGQEMVHTPGTSLISFQQIPRVLESLRGEWSAVPAERCPQCFTEVRGRLVMHMHPCFLGPRLAQGLRGAAGTLLMKYSRVLEQVPLAFKKLEPASRHAAVVGESAYIHFLIDFQCVGFQPTECLKLVGRLGAVQTAVGINCTVFNNFNFFIRKRDLPYEAWFDPQSCCWKLDDKTLGGKTKRPLILQVTKPVEESAGDHPVNFKGVLADHLPSGGLEAAMNDGVSASASSRTPASTNKALAAGSHQEGASSSAGKSKRRKADDAIDLADDTHQDGSTGTAGKPKRRKGDNVELGTGDQEGVANGSAGKNKQRSADDPAGQPKQKRKGEGGLV